MRKLHFANTSKKWQKLTLKGYKKKIWREVCRPFNKGNELKEIRSQTAKNTGPGQIRYHQAERAWDATHFELFKNEGTTNSMSPVDKVVYGEKV